MGNKTEKYPKGFEPRHPSAASTEMRGGLRPLPQRGRAPPAPAPFVNSFLYLPRSGVEVRGLSGIFLSCFLRSRARGVDARRLYSTCRARGVEAGPFFFIFLVFSRICSVFFPRFWPGAFLHFLIQGVGMNWGPLLFFPNIFGLISTP